MLNGSTAQQAQAVINVWLIQYNRLRPHLALAMRPSVPENFLEKNKITGTNIRGWTLSSIFWCSR